MNSVKAIIESASNTSSNDVGTCPNTGEDWF